MRIEIITIFPEMFSEVLRHGILRRAQEARLVTIQTHDLRQWAKDKHRTTDDTPYGGGPGMVMRAEPLVAAVEAVVDPSLPPQRRRVLILSPRGTLLTQACLGRLAELDQIVLVPGRYEGIDERVVETTGAEEVSIGDYVLSGGEIPVMVLVDALVRLLPGALSDPQSAEEDSFRRGLLDHPHYTRPVVFGGRRVPDVLLSGHHGAIRRWRKHEALRATLERRPDLLATASLDDEERAILDELLNGVSQSQVGKA